MKHHCKHCKQDVEAIRSRVDNSEICPTCGVSFGPTGSTLSPGTIVSGFQVESEIGRGGMGVVYKAKQLNLERHVALKVLSDEYAQDIDFVERFFKEARSAASLSHPNIVQAYDAGATPEGIYYFAMELIEGETLDNRIFREGALPFKTALDIALKIAEALSYAWDRQKLSHGDIKPDNIILDSSGGVKLADLGLAKSIHEEHDGGELLVTPLYAPPELIKGAVNGINFHTDLYSFGATLYHMVAGKPPFPGDDANEVFKRHLEETPKPLSEVQRGTPLILSEFVAKLLKKNPEERPSSWKDVVSELQKARDGEHKVFHVGHPDHAPLGAAPTMKSLVGLLVKLAVFVLVLGGAVAGTYFFVLNPRPSSSAQTPDSIAEWDKLKQRLQYLSPAKAQEETAAFIAKYKDASPEAAVKYLEQLKAKIATKQQERAAEEKLKAEFKSELQSLLAAAEPAKWEKNTPAELQALSAKIGVLLKKLADNEAILLPLCPPEASASLKASAAKMSELAKKIVREAEEKRREELARQEQERKDRERKEREEVEAKQKARALQNAMYDDYYLMLSEFIAANDKAQAQAQLLNSISAWAGKHSYPPKELSGKIAFLKRQLALRPELQSLFLSHDVLLEGAGLPDKLSDGFIVEDLDDSGIKLVQQEGKAKLGKKLKWTQLTADNWNSLLVEKILKSEKRSVLTSNEQGMVILYVLSNCSLTQALDAFPLLTKLSAEDKALWEVLLKDFQTSENERKCLQAWQALNEFFKQRDFGNASVSFKVISSLPPGPFHVRYAEDLKRLEAELKIYSPAGQALELMESARRALADPESKNSLDLAMSLAARFEGLEALDKKSIESISAIRKDAIERMRRSSQVKSVQDNRIPFYYWDYETPGEAWVYAQIIQKEVFTRGKHPILPFIQLSAQLQMGDWTAAEASYNNIKEHSQVLMTASGALRNWSSSLMFGLGLAAFQFDTPEAQEAILENLVSLAGTAENPALKALSSALAMEYALMLRQPERAGEIGARYDFSNMPDSLKPYVRVALLHLLSMVQRENVDLKTLSQKIADYEKLFGKDNELKADFSWAKAAVSLLRKEDKKDMKAVLVLRCHAQDVCSRIMLEALSKSFCDGNPPSSPQVESILDAIRTRVSGNTVSSELWSRLFVFELARSCEPGGARMSSLLDKSLLSHRLCTEPVYSRLLLASSAVALSRKTFDEQTAGLLYSVFANGSSVIAKRDARLADTLLVPLNKEQIEQNFTQRASSFALWQGIMAAVAQSSTPAAKITLNALKNYGILCTWEERYLLKTLEAQSK